MHAQSSMNAGNSSCNKMTWSSYLYSSSLFRSDVHSSWHKVPDLPPDYRVHLAGSCSLINNEHQCSSWTGRKSLCLLGSLRSLVARQPSREAATSVHTREPREVGLESREKQFCLQSRLRQEEKSPAYYPGNEVVHTLTQLCILTSKSWVLTVTSNYIVILKLCDLKQVTFSSLRCLAKAEREEAKYEYLPSFLLSVCAATNTHKPSQIGAAVLYMVFAWRYGKKRVYC